MSQNPTTSPTVYNKAPTNPLSLSQTPNSTASYDASYYNSEEYRKYYQQYQQQYASAVPANYTPEQVTAYYEALRTTNPQAYAAIYAQYYGNGASSSALPAPPTTKKDQTSGLQAEGQEDDDDDDDPTVVKTNGQAGSALPVHCNDKMGLNPLIFANINQSPYFKTTLHQVRSYQEIVDEIYYNVKHLEPWERGSRNASGVTGMCGSVRGVSAGGIISTPFCILYKLFLLRLTKKQVQAMIKHTDSVYIRGLGFLYIRYTQQPKDLFRWFEPYLGDTDEIDPRAGGGLTMSIGKMLKKMLTRNEWFSTMFPRIPVPVQKEIDGKIKKWEAENGGEEEEEEYHEEVEEDDRRNDRRHGTGSHHSSSSSSYKRDRKRSRSRSPHGGGSGKGHRDDYRRDKYRSRDRY